MSDWTERANKRRDERHTKEPEKPLPPKASKKNTKKWCKGKVGKEHTLVCMTGEEAKGGHGYRFSKAWRYLVCTACGKELDIYYGDSWIDNKEVKPDWVTK